MGPRGAWQRRVSAATPTPRFAFRGVLINCCLYFPLQIDELILSDNDIIKIHLTKHVMFIHCVSSD
jgi:hypothetical protein